MERSRIKVDEFPCKKLGYCPYGNLVEDFPVEELRSEKGCPVYGHVCPVFSTAEAVDVPVGNDIDFEELLGKGRVMVNLIDRMDRIIDRLRWWQFVVWRWWRHRRHTPGKTIDFDF